MEERRPTAIILISEGFHEIEAFVPFYRFLEIGWQAQFVSPQLIETIRGKYGMTFSEFLPIQKYDYQSADLLIIPGGRSARYMMTRHYVDVQPLVFHFLEMGKPVGAIGHGPLVLAQSKHKVTSFIEVTGAESIANDLRKHVKAFREDPCVIWENIVTAKEEKDLPLFIRSLFHVLFERDRSTHEFTDRNKHTYSTFKE